MALKLTYLGQNDSVNCTPNVVLTGDPGTDQFTLDNAGYYGGKIVALVAPSAGVYTNQPAFGGIGAISPCDSDAAQDGAHASYPFATLLNDSANEFSGAIGASGSKRAPVVRAMWQGNVSNTSFTSGATVGIYDTAATFLLGQPVYCGGATNTNIGQYTSLILKGAHSPVVGICTHVPSATEPWLGVASLI